MAVKIVIHMDGGIVQSVLSSEDIEIAVIDYDTEGVEATDSKLKWIPQSGVEMEEEMEQAYAYLTDPEVMPDRVNAIFQAIDV